MLKKLDLFSQPICFYISSRDKKPNHFFGSYFGFILSILCAGLCMSFFVSLMIRMYLYEDDVYKTQSMPNDFGP